VTVSELARKAGVSVRTLRYYDSIGLLPPADRDVSGYRSYGPAEATRLQEILFFRELDFPLNEIIRIVGSPHYDRDQALRDHRRLLELKRTRIDALISAIDTSLTNEEKTMFDAFDRSQQEKYEEEVKAKYDPTLVAQSQARVAKFTPEDWENIKSESDRICRGLVSVMEAGPDDDRVQALVEDYFGIVNRFYDCSTEIFRGLGEMYVDDPRFRKNYDKYHPELAEFLRDAIRAFCDNMSQG
jgi:DNA-binding transcriptional MerR regulator